MKNYNYLLLITFLALLASVFLVMGCADRDLIGSYCVTEDDFVYYSQPVGASCPWTLESQVPAGAKGICHTYDGLDSYKPYFNSGTSLYTCPWATYDEVQLNYRLVN